MVVGAAVGAGVPRATTIISTRSGMTETEQTALVQATKLLLMAANIPEACIPEDTIRYYLRRSMTPEEIVREVWGIRNAHLGAEV